MHLLSIPQSFFSPPYIFLFTQAPILVWFDGTIIDIISTILVTMYTVGMLGHDRWLCMGINISVHYVCGTRSSMLAGLSCTKGVWYIYDWDTGSTIILIW